MCYTLSCVNYSWTKCFKNCKNISTYGKVIAKIKVACFFLGHGVHTYVQLNRRHCCTLSTFTSYYMVVQKAVLLLQ